MKAQKMTPNLLMLDKEVRLPAEIAFDSNAMSGETVSSYGEYVEKLKTNMQRAHEFSRKVQKDKLILTTIDSFCKNMTRVILFGSCRQQEKKLSVQNCRCRMLVLFWLKRN